MPAVIALGKFVGTISLGLLTGVSYTLSTQSLPSLLTLPSAKPAANTLFQTTRLARAHVRTLSALSSFSLALAFFLSPPRVRHPYLVWTSLAAALSGCLSFVEDRKSIAQAEFTEDEDLNGEQVEKRTRDQQYMEFARMAVSGAGFVMGIVGLWGDGA